MQNDLGNKDGSFVDRVEKAITEFVILNKAQQGEVTKQNIQQVLRQGVFSQGNFAGNVDTSIQRLTRDGNLKMLGDKLTITDDGREDIQKLQSVILDLPQLVGGNVAGQQRQGVSAQRASGSTTGTTTSSSVGSGSTSIGYGSQNRPK